MKNKRINYIALIIYAIVIFGLFFVISRWTPLAGDDWGYAFNGANGNAFNLAIEHYFSWSGRFLSELWGFAIAPNKQLWNILNPLIFTSIFILLTIISSPHKKYFVSGALVMMLMLNVQVNLRMETYTWIMGTTYVIPLLLALLYFYVVEKYIFGKSPSMLMKIISSLIILVGCLFMENITGALFIGVVLLAIGDYILNRKYNWTYLWHFIASATGLAIIRLAPGAQARLESLGAFGDFNIFEKIGYNFPNFIRYTFLENKYLIMTLSVVLIGLIIRRFTSLKHLSSRKHITYILIGIYFLFASVLLFLPNYFDRITIIDISPLISANNPVTWFIWITYVILVFFVIIDLINDNYNKSKIIFYILMAGITNAAMVLSPIFESRSSIYFVYFIIVAIGLLFDNLRIKNRLIILACFIIFSLLSIRKINEYYYKYQKVNQIQNERLEIIKYYQLNPNQDAHIPRMPPYTVHGADIEDDDTYHQEYFKYYYNLPSDMNLIFEWKDSYD